MSLVEILVVIVVIGVLMGIVGLSSRLSFKRAKITRATVEGREIATALKSYYTVYDSWPSSVVDPEQVDEDGYVKLDGNLLQLLRNEGGINTNAVKTVFLEVSPNRIRGGAYIDPWTNAYEVAVLPKQSSSTNHYILTVVPPFFNRKAP